MTSSNAERSEHAQEKLAQLIRSDRNALAKTITIVENNLDGTSAVLSAIQCNLGRAHIVGVTGPPGVGKSTLIDACIAEFRKLGKSVAILAIDPSSHFSGGAILGDRVRMAEHSDDDGVFIRSVAARGHLGGLSATALNIIHLFDAANWDVIIVETVGAGQSEIEIAELADTTVVVESPGMGDEIQAIKAGLLEIADIIAVNKSDLPHADITVSELMHAISMRHSSKSVQVSKTCATERQGVQELVAEIVKHGATVMQSNRAKCVAERSRKIVARVVGESVARQFRNMNSKEADAFAELVQAGELNPDSVAESVIQNLISTLREPSNFPDNEQN